MARLVFVATIMSVVAHVAAQTTRQENTQTTQDFTRDISTADTTHAPTTHAQYENTHDITDMTTAVTDGVTNDVTMTTSSDTSVNSTDIAMMTSHKDVTRNDVTTTLRTTTADGKEIGVNTRAWSDLCSGMCNCQFQRVVLSIVCSQGTNGRKKADINMAMDRDIDSESSREFANTRNNGNQIQFDLDAAKRVSISGFKGTHDILTSLLSLLPSLTKLSITNSTISMRKSVKNDERFPEVKNVTFEHVTFHVENSEETFLALFPNVHSIALMDCNIEHLSEYELSIFQKIQVIDVSYNKIRFLNGTHFPEDSVLASLDASHCKLDSGTLGCGTKSLTNLKILDLAYNEITDVGSMMCQFGIKSLTYLDLSHNLITDIQRDTFDEFKNLIQLDLGHNLIDTIEFGTFGCGLSALVWLSLKDNNLQNVDTNAFYPLQNLREIYLTNNVITHVTDTIDSNRSIAGVTDCIPKYNVLGSEDLDPYPFTHFSVWPHLETIDISQNNLSSIDGAIFEGFFKHAQHLSLAHNYIDSLPAYGIEHLHRLESIDLSHNLIDWIDVGTFTNPHLKNINLSYNKLKKIISMTFLYLPNLENLDLSHNKLSFLYRLAFYKTCKFGQVMTLDFSHNRLTEETIWKFMTSFVEIKNDKCRAELILNKNKVKYFLDASSKKSILRAVRNSDTSMFSKWGHVEVSLSDNQIHCDCQLYKDIRLIKEMSAILFAENNETGSSDEIGFLQVPTISCSKPSHLKGKSLRHVLTRLESSCEANIPGRTEYHTGCSHSQRTAVSVHNSGGKDCAPTSKNKTNAFPATMIALGVISIALIGLVYGLKRTGIVSKLRSKYKWYRVYTDDSTCAFGHTITAHYHTEDKTLIQSELIYFLQECCPAYNIELKESHKNNDAISDTTHQSCRLNINLFVVSHPLMREIKSSAELHGYYQSAIEQETIAIFLFMDEKQEMEAIHPTFWTKVKHRQNVYSVSGEEKLQKLQCVLNSTTANNFFEHEAV